MGTGRGPLWLCARRFCPRADRQRDRRVRRHRGTNDDGIAQADHVAKWDGSDWSAVGSNTAGATGGSRRRRTSMAWPAPAPTSSRPGRSRTPTATRAPTTSPGSTAPSGGRSGPTAPATARGWRGLRPRARRPPALCGGNFTSAGGDPQAQSAAWFDLAQIIAYPTPTVTAGPGPAVTPTATPGLGPVVTPTVTPTPDVTPPRTSLRAARINSAKRRATFRFASGERGSKSLCKLDKKKYKPCTSPKTYKKLKPGKHVFRVKARDRSGNVDRTPLVKRFRIKRG